VRLFILFILSWLFASAARAEQHWPDYRGPDGDGISQSTGLPVKWSETENVRWKTAIHSRGHSSPVIWGEQIWLTTATKEGHKLYALCLDKGTGKILLDKKLFDVAEPQNSNELNSFASPSPAIENGRVYMHFGTYGTACLDTNTFETLWQRRDINCEHFQGPGSSPILYKDKLIFNVDGADVQYIIALNKLTGETIWKTTRTGDYEGVNPDLCKAYSTPLICEAAGRTEMISVGARAAMGYDPESGRELWKVTYTGYSNVWRPLVADGVAYINTGFVNAELWAVKLGGSGDVSQSHVLWKSKKYVDRRPSPLIIDNRIYVLRDSGITACLDAKTGEPIWSQRIGGNFSASLLYADGRIYIFSHEGKATLIKPGDKFEKIAENQLDEGFMASPAISGKALYLRTLTHLYRIENEK